MPVSFNFRLELVPCISNENILQFVRATEMLCPDNEVHGANMGPSWVLSPQMGPMSVPRTLLAGMGNEEAAAAAKDTCSKTQPTHRKQAILELYIWC